MALAESTANQIKSTIALLGVEIQWRRIRQILRGEIVAEEGDVLAARSLILNQLIALLDYSISEEKKAK